MAISAPRSPSSIGMISSQFNDLLKVHTANYERQMKESKEKEENFWAAMSMIGSGLNMTKNLRDDYLSKELGKAVALGGNPLKLYQRGDVPKGLFNKLKGYVWDAKPETSAELKAYFQDAGAESIKTLEGRKGIHKLLKEKGMKDTEIAEVIGISPSEMGYMPYPIGKYDIADDEFLDKDITAEEVDYQAFDVFEDWEEPTPLIVTDY